MRIEKKPTVKEIYFWNIFGSACNACVSVLLLLIVTRMLDRVQSDIFGIGWAIAQLVLTIGTFQVRLYQATDVVGRFTFKQYLAFRVMTVGLMIASSAGYILYYHYTGRKALVVMLLCLYKAVEAVSDVIQGWLQQKERLDLAGKALSARTIFSCAVFLLLLRLTHDLVAGVTGMIICSVICLFLYELRIIAGNAFQTKSEEAFSLKAVRELALTCLPLFLNAFLVMSIFNAPKLAVDRCIEGGFLQSGAQTVYGIIFMPTSVINLMYIVFRPVITRMAIEWNQDHRSTFLRLMKGVLLKLAGLEVIILAGGFLLGIPVLSILYGIDLTDVKTALMILLLAGGMNTFVNVIDNSLTVMRRQYYLIIAYALTWAYSKTAAGLFVKRYGITGAAVTFISSMAVLLLLVLILFCVCLRKSGSEQKTKDDRK